MTRPLDELLAARASTDGDRPFIRFESGEMTYAEVDAAAAELAGGLRGLGIEKGQPCALLLGNRPEFVLLWMALARLGAVTAPVNTAFRGDVLAHVLKLSGARVLALDETTAAALAPVAGALPALETVVACGDVAAVAAQLPGVHVVGIDELRAGARVTATAGAREGDLALILFTSGTTGRSKGCELSQRYVVRHAEIMVERLGLRADDVLYCPFPLFHIDAAVLTVVPALLLGATAALAERFSVSGFWPQVRAFEATVFDFMGATLSLLFKAPERPDDRDNPLRLGWGVPLPECAAEFERRFGVELCELYGLTDAGVVMYPPAGEPRVAGSCGRPIDAFEVCLLDDRDRPVPVGEVGEIALRPREPHLLSEGYFGMPEKTIESRRNLWFHTGDLARRDAAGNYFFFGRREGVIRRRGENISAQEVEEAIDGHPAVLEVAAFGVASELTEEDVMVAVVPRPGEDLEPAELVAWCEERIARFMVPRYVDVVAELPRTATEKVEKHRLAERGVSARTWDREQQPPTAAGQLGSRR